MDLSGLSSVTNASQLTTWLAANMVTPVSPAISASDMGTIMLKIVAILNSGGSGGTGLVIYSVQTGSYTLALTDKAIDMNSSSANTLTIPANASIAFPVGTQILLTQSGTGQTTVAGQSGVTIHSADGKVSLRTQYSWASLVKRATDVWWLSGDLGDTVTPPPPTIVNVNLVGSSGAISGWNNFSLDSSTTPMTLLTSTGGASGMSIVRTSADSDGADTRTTATYTTADFPTGIIGSLWITGGPSEVVSLTLSGLAAGQQYSIKVCASYDGHGDTGTSNFDTHIVAGSQSYSLSPLNTFAEYTLTPVTADGSGEIVITFQASEGGKGVLNGLIIS